MKLLIVFLAVMVLSAWMASLVVNPNNGGLHLMAGGMLTWAISVAIMTLILKGGAEDE
jgi:hypothetical protein